MVYNSADVTIYYTVGVGVVKFVVGTLKMICFMTTIYLYYKVLWPDVDLINYSSFI